MYNFKELRLNNFMSYESMYIDFSQRGLWTINGFNQKGGDSNGCLAGDTLIDCPRNLLDYPRGIPIKDLIGKEFLTYSWNGNQIVLNKAYNVHLVGTKEIVEVKTGVGPRMRRTVGQRNGGAIRPTYWPPLILRGTPDHLVLLTSGEWKPLGKLRRGDSIVSLYRRKDPHVRVKILWTNGDAIPEHQFVCEQIDGKRPDGYHVHHLDRNPFNNDPSNIEWKDAHSHLSEHTSERNKRGLAGWQVSGEHPRGFLGKRHTLQTKTHISETLRNNHIINHKVWSDPEIIGEEPVYDMSVENNSNFIANGMVVHNSGKSALLSGLVWTLFGRTPNGITGKDVVRWGKDNCSGILKLSSNSHTYEIVRSLDSIEFLIDGEKQKGHKKDIQDLINNTFGTDYQLFLTFNIFTKAWSNFITEIGDSGRKKLFKSILMLDQLDKAYDNAKNIYNNLTVQANQAEATIKQLTSTLPELEELLNKNKELAENEEKTKQDAIIEFEKQKEILKSNIQDTNLADAINEIDHEIEQFSKQKIDEKLEYANIQLTGINNLVYHDQMLIKEKEEALKIAGTMGGDCPMCGQKILQKNKKMHIRHLEIMIDEYKESLKNNLHEKLNIEKEIYNFEEINRNIIECGHKRAELEMKIWEQDNNIQKYNDFCKMAEVSIKNLVNNRIDYDKLTKMTQDKINKTQLELDKQSILFNNYLKEIDYFNYLQWLYSRQGIINLIINKCFARLTFLSNRILRRFSSEFKIQISGQKQLKSGDYKDEVDIFVYSGGQKINYDSLSGGQQQRVNIAMLLALYTFGREMGVNQFDCIMLDEILDLSLADKGQEDVLEILYSMKSQISHIILVSHKDNLKGRFDREINVIRDEKGISRMA